MPTPGLGSNTAGDTPQEVVFLVTDGVEDKIISSSSACDPTPAFAGSHNDRCQQPLDTTICTTIKNRGIKSRSSTRSICNSKLGQNITDSWYMTGSTSTTTRRPQPARSRQNLQSCASPGFFSDVSDRRRHLGGADGPVHQGRVKHRQPHAVRKAPWPKRKSHRKRTPQSLRRLYQGQKGRHGGRVRAHCHAVSRPHHRAHPDVSRLLCAGDARNPWCGSRAATILTGQVQSRAD